MKLIYSGRQTGRTTELIKRCGEYRYALIVCPTRKQAEYVYEMSLGMDVNIPMPITFRDFIEGRFFGPNIDAFLIDNLDDCLNTCTKGVPIDSLVFEKKKGAGIYMKCKTCVHYVFEKRIECCHSHGEIQIGRCNLTVKQTGRKYGCMTEAETQGCENHIEQTWKYERGDVLKYGKRTITIISVQPEYSPNAYRVMDNWQSEYGLSENALDECEIIIKGVGAEL